MKRALLKHNPSNVPGMGWKKRWHWGGRQPIKILIPVLVLLSGLVAIGGGMANMERVQEWLAQASGEPANLAVELGNARPMKRIWANIAQGGEAFDYRFLSTLPQLKAVEPEYIRIDHIYDFYNIVGRGADGHLTYDWTKLDEILGDITAAGAVPFISLSYMPPVIAENGDIVGKPRDYGEWTQVIRATIEHVSGKRGLNLDQVYYEVWNEPDLFGGWKTYGEKNYLTLYEYAAYGAQQAQDTNRFYFGGPAITALYQNWVERVIVHAQARGLPLDFFSWHQYDYSAESYATKVAQYMVWAQEVSGARVPTPMITEWGPDPEVVPIYDNMGSAAHMVVALAGLPYEMGRMFAFEWQDGLDPNGQQFWGRWGMLTHESKGSVEKPRYTALSWMQKLDSIELVVEGQGTWVKAKASYGLDGTVQVLVGNFDKAGRNTENVPLVIRELRAGEYRVSRQLLGGGLRQEVVSVGEEPLVLSVTMPPWSVYRVVVERE